MIKITCFKAYDIRGKLGSELNSEVAYRVGRAYAQWLKPETVIVGGDIRPTSEELKMALAEGLRDEGVNVLDIGLCGTEEVYFATSYLKTSGGIMVTASHNPLNYNGLKLVREDSRPVSADTGLVEIRKLAEACDISRLPTAEKGTYNSANCFPAYIEHLLSCLNVSSLKPLKIVVNAGNGNAGPVLDGLEKHLPFEFIKVYHQPDGSFPNGIPNPLLPENRHHTADAVIEHQADLGIAWDGDFDRCFFFDENGSFIEGYYIVGLLAEAFLRKQPGAKIVHDPRLTWNTIDVCEQHGGRAVQSKCGHAFMKQVMREQDAAYGGEMSAHHYFRDFAYCDSGMIPWLLVAELMGVTGYTMSQLIGERAKKFPCSGEINRVVADAAEILKQVESRFANEATSIEHIDGVSMTFSDWRFNLRMSNTEPVVRLNIEARAYQRVEEKTRQILAMLDDSPVGE
ncbi:MAG: phosphomannomutase CpsG [Pseudomonadales bacterium]|nr:phosphomannomutase CpsG [Pseudomonadales bacterium]